MKHRFFRFIVVTAVLGVCAFAAEDRTTATAQIPFPFRMGAAVLPAGDYKIIENAQSGYLAMANLDTRARGALLSTPGRPLKATDTCRLVFHRYGDRFFLAEVWSVNGGYVRQVTPSAAEKEIIKAKQPAQIAHVLTKVAR